MRTDLNASALLYFLEDDVMEGTHSELMQRGFNGHLQVQTPANYSTKGLKRVTLQVMETLTRVIELDCHYEASTRVMHELAKKRPPLFRAYHTLPHQSLACPHDTIC